MAADSVIYVTATRSPDRVARWEQVDHYNALVRAYCGVTPHHTFVDINPALVDGEGRRRLELYQADKLHFHPPAYVEFAAIIKPVLTRVWEEAVASTPTSSAKPISENKDLQAFLNCQLVPKLGNAWDYTFEPGKLPAVEWNRPEVVEKIGGSFTLKVRWFDGEGREVTAAERPGRYAFYAEGTTPGGMTIRRSATLFCRPKNWDGWSVKLKASLAKIAQGEIVLSIHEIRRAETDAQLVAESIATQLERRVAFRRAMRKAMQSAQKFGIKGIRVACAGRLGGAEMGRYEWYREGRGALRRPRSGLRRPLLRMV